MMCDWRLAGTGTGRQHIGVVTFDGAIHFYSFNADRTGYHMLLVPDGERPFAPAASSSLVVPLQAARDTVSLRQGPSWQLSHAACHLNMTGMAVPLIQAAACPADA